MGQRKVSTIGFWPSQHHTRVAIMIVRFVTGRHATLQSLQQTRFVIVILFPPTGRSLEPSARRGERHMVDGMGCHGYVVDGERSPLAVGA